MIDLLLATSGGEAQAAGGGYVDDVFSAYVRTGTGADVTVNTNIDMTKGYMLWTKGRSGATDHAIYDSARGVTFDLASNLTSAQTTQSTGLKSVSGTGHTIGSLAKMNTNAATYVDWVFRKAPKFFDVVTYTGDGTSNRQIAHNLDVAPGMVIVKCTSNSDEWPVYHRSLGATHVTRLGSTIAAQDWGLTYWNNTAPTSSVFSLGYNVGVNGVGRTYVAYLFAHDPSADGIIQCGSFTTDGSGNATVNLGWEPQYVLTKRSDSSTLGQWLINDTMRGMPTTDTGVGVAYLQAESSNPEAAGGYASPIATGFRHGGGATSATHIYLAIRRPNKPPTSGTEVYNAIARTGTSAAATVTGVGFAPDLVIPTVLISSGGNGSTFHDRLRGKQNILFPTGVNAELARTDANMYFRFGSDGIEVGADSTTFINYTGYPYINWFFRRAKGFFDVVCDTGTGVAHGVNHGLSAAPEFVIRKSRSGATHWECWHSALTATEKLVLNSTAAKVTDATAWNSTLPTSTQFTVGTGANVNTNAATYVTYLFATLAGISKVGSYTGNGTSQTINCGFATGARFFLVKATSTTGNWWVFDSTRGIVSSSDPALALNSTAAEITSADAVDPDPLGIVVNQEATCSINASGVSYIYLAIA